MSLLLLLNPKFFDSGHYVEIRYPYRPRPHARKKRKKIKDIIGKPVKPPQNEKIIPEVQVITQQKEATIDDFYDVKRALEAVKRRKRMMALDDALKESLTRLEQELDRQRRLLAIEVMRLEADEEALAAMMLLLDD